MAGAGAPIVTPLSWPVGHVLAAVTKAEDDKPGKVGYQSRQFYCSSYKLLHGVCDRYLYH